MKDTAATKNGEPEAYNALVGTTSTNTYQTQNFDWIILKIDEDNDNLTIVADGIAKYPIYLSGAHGYNNGVKLLHTIGEKLYSKRFNRCSWTLSKYR